MSLKEIPFRATALVPTILRRHEKNIELLILSFLYKNRSNIPDYDNDDCCLNCGLKIDFKNLNYTYPYIRIFDCIIKKYNIKCKIKYCGRYYFFCDDICKNVLIYKNRMLGASVFGKEILACSYNLEEEDLYD